MTLTALTGLLGSGKSTIARELRAPDVDVFTEPEERDYPDFQGEGFDPIAVHTWFRDQRVLGLLSAVASDREHQVVDSYYDLMLDSYVDDSDFAWLVGGDPTHLPALRALSRRDRAVLPRADRIVFLHVDEPTWLERLAARARRQDAELAMASRFSMQEKMLRACRELAALDGSSLIVLDTTPWTVDRTAREVARLVRGAA